MTDQEIAAQILRLAGGPENLRSLDMCFTRLRLVLVDPGAVDVAGIEAIPAVAMTFTQSGQYQVVLGARVRAVHAALRDLLHPS
jgi:PTS system trehalose-specific IIC component